MRRWFGRGQRAGHDVFGEKRCSHHVNVCSGNHNDSGACYYDDSGIDHDRYEHNHHDYDDSGSDNYEHNHHDDSGSDNYEHNHHDDSGSDNYEHNHHDDSGASHDCGAYNDCGADNDY
jgi:hypothetical protein